jgi:hypothetical protein
MAMIVSMLGELDGEHADQHQYGSRCHADCDSVLQVVPISFLVSVAGHGVEFRLRHVRIRATRRRTAAMRAIPHRLNGCVNRPAASAMPALAMVTQPHEDL